jgi:PilZ domain
MPKCPKCHKGFIRRSHRLGLLERLLSIFLIYPFRCQLCTYRFLAFHGNKSEARHREYERLPVRLPVSFNSTSAGEQIKGDGIVVGLSIRGCALTADQLLPTGSFLRLRLVVEAQGSPIEIDVAVVRSTVNHRAGLEFLSIRDEEDKRLRAFVEGLLKGKSL